MARGADKRDVFRMVVGQGLALALAGLAIGVVVALVLTRVLPSFSLMLYGVGASDPVTSYKRECQEKKPPRRFDADLFFSAFSPTV
jgi:ABC-type antimicrobial peptide transport system permease subunit